MQRRDKQAHWYYAGEIFPPPRRAGRRLTRAVANGRLTIAEHWRASIVALALITAGFALFLLGNRPPDVGSSVSALQYATSTTTTTHPVPPPSTMIPPSPGKGSVAPNAGPLVALPDTTSSTLPGSHAAKPSRTAATTKSAVVAPSPSPVAATVGPTVIAVSVSPPTTAATWPASTSTVPPPTTTTTTTSTDPPPPTTTTTTTGGP